ncbi:hypothetical protein CEXT_469941 [Caerostris extrusa]|uniref:Uncharacterized protein n=1 Tax=Caerostris extrusa TaxID=172846 RepID=A0AAV4Y0A7_CAEEX|nr:hypothetical protein CEXT_469941 [Caerostris extrusa]
MEEIRSSQKCHMCHIPTELSNPIGKLGTCSSANGEENESFELFHGLWRKMDSDFFKIHCLNYRKYPEDSYHIGPHSSNCVFYYRCPEHNNRYVLSIVFVFDKEEDVYHFAFSYPYSYTRLQKYMESLESKQLPYFKREKIGETLTKTGNLKSHFSEYLSAFQVSFQPSFITFGDLFVELNVALFQPQKVLGITLRYSRQCLHASVTYPDK